MSLLGSVIIVLHAPPDQDIETVDQILAYAIKPGQYTERKWLRNATKLTHRFRFSALLHRRRSFLHCHDLQSRAAIWQKEPPYLHLHLLDSRLGISHGH